VTADRNWPTTIRYTAAVRQAALAFRDDELRRARFHTADDGSLTMAEGENAVVFFADLERDIAARTVAVRCLKRELTAGIERYAHLNEYLNFFPINAFAEAVWEEDGIDVDGDTWPVVTMERVAGSGLARFVDENNTRPEVLRGVADNWRTAAAEIAVARVAHGDLDAENIMVTPDLRLRLVDLDSVWTSSTAHLVPAGSGHRHFQHPERIRTGFWGRYVDAFPALVVYVSLRAVAADPGLWNYHNGENLIFADFDFRNPGGTSLWGRIGESPDPEVPDLARLLAQFCGTTVDVPADLKTLLATGRIPEAPGSVAPRPASAPTEDQPPLVETVRRPVHRAAEPASTPGADTWPYAVPAPPEPAESPELEATIHVPRSRTSDGSEPTTAPVPPVGFAVRPDPAVSYPDPAPDPLPAADTAAPLLPPPATPEPRRIGRRLLIGGGAAAVVAAGLGVTWALRRPASATGSGLAKPRPSTSVRSGGTALWTVAVPPNVIFAPLLVDGTIIVEGDDMVAVRVSDGSVVWRLAGTSHHVASSGGQLYVQQGVEGHRTVTALRISDGTMTSTVNVAHSILALTVTGDNAYYLGSDHAPAAMATVLRAIDVRDGSVLWTFTKPLYLSNLPIVDDTAVYVGGVGVVWAISRQDGSVLWSRALPSTPRPSIRAVTNGLIVVRGIDGTYALDPATGEIRWKLVAPDVPFLRSAAGIADDVMYTSSQAAGATTGYIRKVRLADGSQLWQENPTTGNNLAIAYRSTVYASEGQAVIAAGGASGDRLWRYALNGPCVVEPVGAGDAVIVPTTNGWLHAVAAGA
jgi:outer membrane protein assembly factor BamB